MSMRMCCVCEPLAVDPVEAEYVIRDRSSIGGLLYACAGCARILDDSPVLRRGAIWRIPAYVAASHGRPVKSKVKDEKASVARPKKTKRG